MNEADYEKELKKLDPASLVFELESEIVTLAVDGKTEHYRKITLAKRELLRRLRS